jgi:hypothetical protein
MSSKLSGSRSLTAEAAEAPVMASAAVRNWGIRTIVAVLFRFGKLGGGMSVGYV